MKKNKLLACLMSGVMAVTAIGCGGTEPAPDTTGTVTETGNTESPDTTEPVTTEPVEETTPVEEVIEASVDFEDGNYAFAKVCLTKGSPDNSELAVSDFNGSKALQMINVDGKNMFLGINVDALLGADVEKLATIKMDIGTTHSDGKFYASSGNFYTYTGESLTETKVGAWSVYIESGNPNRLSFDVSGFVAGADNYILLTKESDAAYAGVNAGDLYVDNVAFYDKDGNLLAADSGAEFGSPAGFESSGEDRSNLYSLVNVIESDVSVSNSAWAQSDIITIDETVLEKLVPGSVIEISYASETGNMWVVMNGAAAGWMRVGVGDCDGSGQGYSYMNNSRTIAQVTYEQIAEFCGDDVSTWGGTIQAESDGAFEVYSVRIGQAATTYALSGATDIGKEASGGAWAQADIVTIDDDVLSKLVPGSVLEISYASETGELWVVMNGAAAGWMRVGVGDYDGSGQGYAVFDGSTCYITYEQIAEYCGDDPTTWGGTIQAEASSNWEVYGVRIGKAVEMYPLNKVVTFDNQASAGAWAQADILDLTDEAVLEALVPGSVVTVTYASETGECWVVMNGAAAGWMRVGVGDYDGSGQGYAACDGKTVQIPYEMIAEYCGNDVSTWGPTMQAEASSAWEVFSVSIGQR